MNNNNNNNNQQRKRTQNRYRFQTSRELSSKASVEAVLVKGAAGNSSASTDAVSSAALPAPDRLREATPQSLATVEQFTHFSARLQLLLERDGHGSLRAFSPMARSLPLLLHRRHAVTQLLCEQLTRAVSARVPQAAHSALHENETGNTLTSSNVEHDDHDDAIASANGRAAGKRGKGGNVRSTVAKKHKRKRAAPSPDATSSADLKSSDGVPESSSFYSFPPHTASLLSLAVAFARDLRSHLEPELARSLLLAVRHVAHAATMAAQPVPVLLESIFQSLSLLIRYLYPPPAASSRSAAAPLVQQCVGLFDLWAPALGGRHPLQRQLCAEALSILWRRCVKFDLKSRSDEDSGTGEGLAGDEAQPSCASVACLFDHAVAQLLVSGSVEHAADGLSRWLFFGVRGPAGRLHSSGPSLLRQTLLNLVNALGDAAAGSKGDRPFQWLVSDTFFHLLAVHLCRLPRAAPQIKQAASEARLSVWRQMTSACDTVMSSSADADAAAAAHSSAHVKQLVFLLHCSKHWWSELMSLCGPAMAAAEAERANAFQLSLLSISFVRQCAMLSEPESLISALEAVSHALVLRAHCTSARMADLPGLIDSLLFTSASNDHHQFGDLANRLCLHFGLTTLFCLVDLGTRGNVESVHEALLGRMFKYIEQLSHGHNESVCLVFGASLELLTGRVPACSGDTDIEGFDLFGMDSSFVDDDAAAAVVSAGNYGRSSVVPGNQVVFEEAVDRLGAVWTMACRCLTGNQQTNAADSQDNHLDSVNRQWLSAHALGAAASGLSLNVAEQALAALLRATKDGVDGVAAGGTGKIVYSALFYAMCRMRRRLVQLRGFATHGGTAGDWRSESQVAINCLQGLVRAAQATGQTAAAPNVALWRACVIQLTSACRLLQDHVVSDDRTAACLRPTDQDHAAITAFLDSDIFQAHVKSVLLTGSSETRLRVLRCLMLLMQLAALTAAGGDAEQKSTSAEQWTALLSMAVDVESIVRRVTTHRDQSMATIGDDARVVSALLQKLGRRAARLVPNCGEPIAETLIAFLCALSRARWRMVWAPANEALQTVGKARPALFGRALWQLATAGPDDPALTSGATTGADEKDHQVDAWGSSDTGDRFGLLDAHQSVLRQTALVAAGGRPGSHRAASDFVARIWGSLSGAAASVERFVGPLVACCLMRAGSVFCSETNTPIHFLDDPDQATRQLGALIGDDTANKEGRLAADRLNAWGWSSRQGRQRMVALLNFAAALRRPSRRLPGLGAGARRTVRDTLSGVLLQLCAVADSEVQTAALACLLTWGPSLSAPKLSDGGPAAADCPASASESDDESSMVQASASADGHRDASDEEGSASNRSESSHGPSVDGEEASSNQSTASSNQSTGPAARPEEGGAMRVSLRHYQSQLEKLVDDRRIREQLVVFRLDESVDPAHRSRIAEICVALLYGKLRQNRSVAGARGANRRAGRRTAILRWLCACDPKELQPLANAVLAPVLRIIGDQSGYEEQAESLLNSCDSTNDLARRCDDAAGEAVQRAGRTASALRGALTARQRVAQMRSIDEMLRILPTAFASMASSALNAVIALAEAARLDDDNDELPAGEDGTRKDAQLSQGGVKRGVDDMVSDGEEDEIDATGIAPSGESGNLQSQRPMSRRQRHLQIGNAFGVVAHVAELLGGLPAGHIAALVPMHWLSATLLSPTRGHAPDMQGSSSDHVLSRLGKAALQSLMRCVAVQPRLLSTALCSEPRNELLRALLHLKDTVALDICELLLRESCPAAADADITSAGANGATGDSGHGDDSDSGDSVVHVENSSSEPLQLSERVVCAMLDALAARSAVTTAMYQAELKDKRAGRSGGAAAASAGFSSRRQAQRALDLIHTMALRLPMPAVVASSESLPSASLDNRFGTRNNTAFSSPTVAAGLAKAVLPWLSAKSTLQRLSFESQRALFECVDRTLPFLSANQSQLPRDLADALFPLLAIPQLAAGASAAALLNALDSVSKIALPTLRPVVQILKNLSAMDKQYVGIPDYTKRNEGFESINKNLVRFCLRQPQLCIPPLLHSLLGIVSSSASISSGAHDNAVHAAAVRSLQAMAQTMGILVCRMSVDDSSETEISPGSVVGQSSGGQNSIVPQEDLELSPFEQEISQHVDEYLSQNCISNNKTAATTTTTTTNNKTRLAVRSVRRLCQRLFLAAIRRGLGHPEGAVRGAFLAVLGSAARFFPQSLLGDLRHLMVSGGVAVDTLVSLEHISAQRRRRALRRLAAALRLAEGSSGATAVQRYVLPVLVAQLASASPNDPPSQRNALTAAVDAVAACAERMAWPQYCDTVAQLLNAATRSGSDAARSALASRAALPTAGHRSKAAKRTLARAQRGLGGGSEALSAPAAACFLRAACAALDAFPFRAVLDEGEDKMDDDEAILNPLIAGEAVDAHVRRRTGRGAGVGSDERVVEGAPPEEELVAGSPVNDGEGVSSDDDSLDGQNKVRRRRPSGRRRLPLQSTVGMNEVQQAVTQRLLPLLYDHITEMTRRAAELAGAAGRVGPAQSQAGGSSAARRRREQDRAAGEAALLAVVAPAAARLCRLLPARIRAQEMPRLLNRACASLRSRSPEARAAGLRTLLAGCEALGPAYFHYVVAELRGRLRRGFQRSVLAHALHELLALVTKQPADAKNDGNTRGAAEPVAPQSSDMAVRLQPGDLDHCVPALVQSLLSSVISFAVGAATAATEATSTSTAAAAATTLVAAADSALMAVSQVTAVGEAGGSLAKSGSDDLDRGGANAEKTPEAAGGAARANDSLRMLASTVSFADDSSSSDDASQDVLQDRVLPVQNGKPDLSETQSSGRLASPPDSVAMLQRQLPSMVSLVLCAPVAALAAVAEPSLVKPLEQAVMALGHGLVENPDADGATLLHIARVCCAAGGADSAATKADDALAAQEAEADRKTADGGLVEIDEHGNPVNEQSLVPGDTVPATPNEKDSKRQLVPAKQQRPTAFPVGTHLVPADPRPTGQREAAAKAAQSAQADRPVLLRLGLQMLRAVLVKRQRTPPSTSAAQKRKTAGSGGNGRGEDLSRSRKSVGLEVPLDMLDPFVAICTAALRSQRSATAVAACSCLTRLAGLPLAAWQRGASARVARRLLVIAGRAGAARGTGVGAGEVGMDRGARAREADQGNELLLAAACGALAAVMRARQRLQVPVRRLSALLELSAAEIDDNRARPGAVALLRAVLARQLQTPAVYQAAEAAGRAAVRSGAAGELGNQCRAAFVSFLCNFPLSSRAFANHIDSLVTAASSYELADGRSAALQVLADLIRRLSPESLAPHAARLFLALVVIQGADDNSAVRAQAAAATTQLVCQCTGTMRSRLLALSISWYLGQTESQDSVPPSGDLVEKPTETGGPDASGELAPQPVANLKLCAAGGRALACFVEQPAASLLSTEQVRLIMSAVNRVVPAAQFQRPDKDGGQNGLDDTFEENTDSVSHGTDSRGGWLLLHLSLRLVERLLDGEAQAATGDAEGDTRGNVDHATGPSTVDRSKVEAVDCVIPFAIRLLTYPHNWVRAAACRCVERRCALASVLGAARAPSSRAAKKHRKGAADSKLSESAVAIGRAVPGFDDPECLGETCFRLVGVIRRAGNRDPEAESAARVLLFMVPLLQADTRVAQFVGKASVDAGQGADVQPEVNESDQGGDGRQALHWLFRQLSFLARRGGPSQQRSVFKLFAGASTRLSHSQLNCYLMPMLHPLVRAAESREPGDTADELRALAGEVMAVLQNAAGSRSYFQAYEVVHSAVLSKRSARKRERAEQQMSNPALAAQRKSQASMKNRERKKRRIREHAPGKNRFLKVT